MTRGKLSWRETLIVSRPLWWVATAVPFLAGSLLAKESLSLTLVVGTLYFLIPYNLLVYGTNDIFDYESDIRNERKSGVAHGKVLPRLKQPALRKKIAFWNAPFILFLVLAGNLESNVFLLMMIYMAFAYSITGLRYKEIPFIDSLTSAFHYASPFIFGLFLFESPQLWASAFAGFYFWSVGNHAFGAIQDIAPDREAGIKSVATFLGAGRTILFTLFAYILAVVAPILGYGLEGLVALAAVLPYFLTVLATYRHRRNDKAPQFRMAWRKFLLLNYIVGAAGSIALINLYNR